MDVKKNASEEVLYEMIRLTPSSIFDNNNDDDDDDDEQSNKTNRFSQLVKEINYLLDLKEIENDPFIIPNQTVNLLSQTEKQIMEKKKRIKDKSDRATAEHVMDNATRLILFKIIDNYHIEKITGCISSGKEANVYHAICTDKIDKAVKIYKRSSQNFRNRNKYILGEFRYQGCYDYKSHRMARIWAEKEMRNLSRMNSVGIKCPKVYATREHMVIMELIGKDGIPAPILKNATLSVNKCKKLYLECILMMRTLFQEARLVHADLSEYNLLYYDSSIYVIDVSQSVESDHPFALEFLRNDCTNINDFFSKKQILTMNTKELFNFITDPNINEDNIDEYLEKAQKIAEQRDSEQKDEIDVDEEVFRRVYIAQRLGQIVNYEEKNPNKDQTYYRNVVGMNKELNNFLDKPALLIDDNEQQSTESSSESNDNHDNHDDDNDNGDDKSGKNSKFKNSARPKNETPEEKKLRKLLLKLDMRKKRQNKIPKHVKKRKEKLAHKNK